jgi:hypothetical protein
MAFDQDTLDLLDESVEVDMVTPRRDGSLSKRPIWVVVVDDSPYVRSYRGPSGAWYKRALADGRAVIEVAGQSIEAAAEPEHGEEINERVSDAFRAKYAESSPGPTEAMVSAEVSATTLRLTG